MPPPQTHGGVRPGAPRAHPLLPGRFGKIFVSHQNKTSARPLPQTELGRGRAPRPRSRSPPGSRSAPRGWLGCARGSGPGRACLTAAAAGEAARYSPGAREAGGEATAQAARRPLPTPHLAIVLALVKWKAKETRMERQGTRRSGQGRDDAQPGRAGGQTRIAYVRSLPLTGHLLFAAGRQSRPPPRGRRAWGRRAGSQGVARGGTRP